MSVKYIEWLRSLRYHLQMIASGDAMNSSCSNPIFLQGREEDVSSLSPSPQAQKFVRDFRYRDWSYEDLIVALVLTTHRDGFSPKDALLFNVRVLMKAIACESRHCPNPANLNSLVIRIATAAEFGDDRAIADQIAAACCEQLRTPSIEHRCWIVRLLGQLASKVQIAAGRADALKRECRSLRRQLMQQDSAEHALELLRSCSELELALSPASTDAAAAHASSHEERPSADLDLEIDAPYDARLDWLVAMLDQQPQQLWDLSSQATH